MQLFEYLHDQDWEETARMSLQNWRQILLYELCVWNMEKAMQEQGKPVSFTVYHLHSLRAGCEDDFAHLIGPSRSKFFL